MKMTAAQLKSAIEKAISDAKNDMIVFKPEDCIVKWTYLVSDYVQGYTYEIEDDTRDQYGAPNGKINEVGISFSIEDFENQANIKLAENGPVSTTLKIDRTWNRDTKFMTLAKLMDVLSKAAPDGEIKVNYGDADVVQEIDPEGIYVQKGSWPSDPSVKTNFRVALFLGTYESITASEQDIEDYIEANRDQIDEIARDTFDYELKYHGEQFDDRI